ncbi:cell adhesion molecule 2-like isoform X2 [Anneissia japonica]|uniref:cell adhesion molecule 2-like isoform X2 n=1 Tax=Anneissia japonica TaxID=1529436 RepID=UPI0014254F89|nr:cell adhesion molecule 2-like isoform X2 [Anneissia japonica]
MYKLQKNCFAFLIILMVSLRTAESTASFLKEPSDVIALRGKDATFTCTIENLEPGYIVQWIQSVRVVLSQNGNVSVNVHPMHFQIDANRDRGEYNLTIKSVTSTDDNQYSCAVFENEDSLEPIISSRDVRLTVNFLPSEAYPECSETQGNGIYNEGDYIELCCESERASPPVTLQWTTNDKVIGLRQDIRIDDSENGIHKIIYKFNATAAHNGMSFSCILATSADSTYRRSCSTGPIEVRYKPQVLISNYEKAVAPGQEILFFCNSTANPVATSFRWELEPAIDADRLHLNLDNQTMQMLNTKPKDNGTNIKCFASNTIGDGHAQLILLVHPYPTTTPRSVVATTHFSASIFPNERKKKGEETLTLAITLCIATIGCIMLILLLTIVYNCKKKKDKGVNYIPKLDYYFTPTGLGNSETATGRSASTDRPHRYDEPIYQEVE